MLPLRLKLRKYTILCHRWLGVGFCLLFALWFLSGIVMMYCDYPAVSREERLARAAVLEPRRIRLSPDEVLARLQLKTPPQRVRITMLDGRPVYRFHYGALQYAAFADNGQLLTAVSPDAALRIASAWVAQPATEATLEALLTEADQWTVSQAFRPLRPLLKYSWSNGETVYLSRAGGEVVQHTTRWSRLGAYFGAIPHWLYFTPLRERTPMWRVIVIALSGLGMLAALFGLAVGVWLYSPSRRYRFPRLRPDSPPGYCRSVLFPEGPSSIPYAGQKRWHTTLGLIFGLFACAWIFSGMLSMNPLGWSPEGADPALPQALRGTGWQVGVFSVEHTRAALEQAAASELEVKELELAFFAGEPVYLAAESPERTRVIPLGGAPQVFFRPLRVLEAVAAFAGAGAIAESRVLTAYDSYYLDRHRRKPLPVLYIGLSDADHSGYYVDLRTGRVVQSYVTRSRWNRWLYHGLHSWDFPWLYRNRPAWDVFVLTGMAGGTLLSLTAVVIGWRRLRRTLPGRRRRKI
jgi:hypothetical protein